jgi:hypothetical protein
VAVAQLPLYGTAAFAPSSLQWSLKEQAMQNTATGASFIRSTVFGNQRRARTLFGLVGRHCGLDAANTGAQIYELLSTPQTAETLQRAMAHDGIHRVLASALDSFLAELYRRDLIVLSPDT